MYRAGNSEQDSGPAMTEHLTPEERADDSRTNYEVAIAAERKRIELGRCEAARALLVATYRSDMPRHIETAVKALGAHMEGLRR